MVQGALECDGHKIWDKKNIKTKLQLSGKKKKIENSDLNSRKWLQKINWIIGCKGVKTSLGPSVKRVCFISLCALSFSLKQSP